MATARSPAHVLHILPLDLARGAQTYAGALRDALDGRPDEHRTLTIFGSESAILDADIRLAIAPGRARQRGLDPRAVVALARTQRRLRPDVVVAHGGEPLKYAALAKRRGQRLVYLKIGESSGDVRSSAQRRLYRLLMKRVDLVVCVADELATEARALFGLSGDRIAVIPNGRDPEQYRPRDSTGAEASDAVPDELMLVWVGNLNEGKRPDWFIHVVRQLREQGHAGLGARMIGDGPLEGSLRTECESLGIELMGRRSDVAQLLVDSDILAFTSVSEGMPGVLIEAGLCGLPVVTTEVSGARTVVHDGETGFVVGLHDRSALAARVAELVADPALRQRMGAAARQRCLQRFTLQAGARSWQQTIDSLLGRSDAVIASIGAGASLDTKEPLTIEPATVLVSAAVAFRRTPGGSVIIARCGPSLEPIRLDATGPLIWDLIDGERSLGAIADTLTKRLGADPEVVLRDVALAARHLCDLGVAVAR